MAFTPGVTHQMSKLHAEITRRRLDKHAMEKFHRAFLNGMDEDRLQFYKNKARIDALARELGLDDEPDQMLDSLESIIGTGKGEGVWGRSESTFTMWNSKGQRAG